MSTSPDSVVAAWLRLWNGEYAVADALIAPSFTLHAALLGGASDDDVRDGAALVAWIASIRSVAEDLAFAIEIGPLVDGDRIAVRWRATGRYAGGFPGAAARPGAPIDFAGTDLLRVEDGRIAEYWVNSDVHVLLDQLAVRPA